MADKYSVTISHSTYKSLKLLLLLNRVSFVFQYKVVKSSRSVRLMWDRKYQILGLTVIIIAVLLSVYGLTVNFQKEVIHSIRLKKTSGRIITFLDFGYLISTSSIIFVIMLMNLGHFSRYLKLISEVDMILKYPSKNNSNACFLTTTLVTTGLIFVADICIWCSFLPSCQIMSYVFHQLPIYFIYYIHLLAIINFHILVSLLSSRFAFLGGLLEDSRKIKVSTFGVLNKSCLGNKFQNSLGSQKLDMVHIYDLLYEASLSLNNYYGLILMFLLIGCLLHLLVTPYDLYLEIFHRHYSFIFSQTIWMLGHCMRLFLIVNPCEQMREKLGNLSAILIRILWTDHRFDVSQLGVLTLQMLHCPIRFTAAGLTEVNRSLITSIAAGVTTYLVILFQFTTTEP